MLLLNNFQKPTVEDQQEVFRITLEPGAFPLPVLQTVVRYYLHFSPLKLQIGFLQVVLSEKAAVVLGV